MHVFGEEVDLFTLLSRCVRPLMTLWLVPTSFTLSMSFSHVPIIIARFQILTQIWLKLASSKFDQNSWASLPCLWTSQAAYSACWAATLWNSFEEPCHCFQVSFEASPWGLDLTRWKNCLFLFNNGLCCQFIIRELLGSLHQSTISASPPAHTDYSVN